jgi:hypothetical protein
LFCATGPARRSGAVKKFSEQNTNSKEHDEFYKNAGVTREHAWLQRSPPNSGAPDLEIVKYGDKRSWSYV